MNSSLRLLILVVLTFTLVVAQSPETPSTLRLSLYSNGDFLGKGSIDFSQINDAKNHLFKLDIDLETYDPVYRGLIISFTSQAQGKEDVFSNLLESSGTTTYIPYRYMSIPVCTVDPFLGISCLFNFQRGNNSVSDFTTQIALSYGNCETGITKDNMDFINSAIKILLINHKDLLSAKIDNANKAAESFAFNTKFYNDVVSKMTQAQQLDAVTTQLTSKTKECNEIQTVLSDSGIKLNKAESTYNNLKPVIDQNKKDIDSLSSEKKAMETQQAEKQDKTKNYENSKARYDQNIIDLQSNYDLYTSAIFPWINGYSCSQNGINQSFPALMNIPNMSNFLSSQVAQPQCSYTLGMGPGRTNNMRTIQIADSYCSNCVDAETAQNDRGDSVIFLDRHYFTCQSGTVLNAFAIRNPNGKLNIQYRCIRTNFVNFNTCKTNQTGWNAIGGGYEYLDRQAPYCAANEAMQGWGIVRNGSNMAIKFVCCQVTGSQVVSAHTTRLAELANFNANSIGDSMAVVGGDLRAINGFRMSGQWENAWKTDYQTITLTNNLDAMTRILPKYTSLNQQNNGSVFYLDRHDVTCNDPNSVLNSFTIENWYNFTQFRYRYNCSQSAQLISNNCNENVTQWDATDSNENTSVNFLDRHTLTCGKNAAIKGFRMTRYNSFFRYVYNCCELNNVVSSEVYSNNWTDAGGWSMVFLDRQWTTGLPDEVINSLSFQVRYDGNQLRYWAEYTRIR